MSKTVEGLVTIVEPVSRVPEEDVLRIMGQHGLFKQSVYPWHLFLDQGKGMVFRKQITIGWFRESIGAFGQVEFLGISKVHETLVKMVAKEIAEKTGLKVEIQLK